MTLAAQVEAEIVGLHAFLEDWFTAVLPRSAEAFSRLARSWSRPFLLVAPDNELLDADTLLETTMAQHGEFPALSIAIRNLRVTIDANGAAAVALYEEWHVETGQPDDVRLCSATFAADASRPHGVRWMHVHESRLDRHASRAA